MKRSFFFRELHSGTFYLLLVLISAGSVLLVPYSGLYCRNPIRNTFFSIYPQADNTQLDDLPSIKGHCGVCHFDFKGGGPRNPYGLGVEIGLNSGLSNSAAILALDGVDSDADGFKNGIEAGDIVNFTNTPTFPGLTSGNKNNTLNVNIADIEPYLTPSGSTDTTPPSVDLTSPDGGEIIQAESFFSVNYSATDASGISYLNIYLSDDGGSTFEPVGTLIPPGTGFSWFVPNLPGAANRIMVEAWDNAANPGSDVSISNFTITGTPPGYVPSSLRDMKMSGTQPHRGAVLDDPDLSCASCHGNYDTNSEPWYNWRGSMMAQAARDPLFFACMAIAEQDAPSVGDICLRCHTPGGWQEGRSVDTSGDMLTVKDRHGVHCDFCHRVVDYDYVPGTSPMEDLDVLAQISPLPLQYANGQFINDPSPLKRGPYADAEASHAFVESPIHRSSNICGTCHDVSNMVFNNINGMDYAPNNFDEEHPDMDLRNMFPVERTFSEWSRSEYALTGVYAPQFAGDKPDGIVSTCQDCHMRDVTGKGANANGVNNRSDLGLHDLTGGNTFVPRIISTYFPDEVDQGQLDAAVDRALSMLQKAATLEISPEDYGVSVKVTNQTGHKLPSGYPEGRRIWLNLVAKDQAGQIVFESCHYDFETADLTHDSQAKVYEIHPGLSPGLAQAIGLPAGVSFHFVLNDTVYSDNRIPPRGFTNAAFEEIQSPPVDYVYEDGQYWDITHYNLPVTADSVIATLYYQTTSKEYVEFLRNENRTNSAGQNLYNSWMASGKSQPEIMARGRAAVDVTVTDAGEMPFVYNLEQNYPNPFNPTTRIRYSVAEKSDVLINIYNISGQRVRTLANSVHEPGRYTIDWDGRNDRGDNMASGLYFIRFSAGSHSFTRKAVLLR